MRTVIVIPARYASKRYPGKPLAMLRGATGKEFSLIQRCYQAAQAVPEIARVVVATDDERIKSHAQVFGAEVVMTPATCANGTERCAAVLDVIGADWDIVVNLQGDAPLTPSWAIENIVAGLRNDPSADLATPVIRCDGADLAALKNDRAQGRIGGTTAVLKTDRHALYFSKEVIPHTADDYADDQPTPVFHHIGAYAYRPETLRSYHNWPVGPLEQLEGLEQLRFLENDHKILCVETDLQGQAFWELNNPSDTKVIEAALARMKIE